KITLPKNKSISDLEHALKILPRQDLKIVVGAHRDHEGRTDHGFVNLLLASRHANVILVDEKMWIRRVANEELPLLLPEGSLFSIVALDKKPISVSGALFSCERKSFQSPSFGLSNRARKKEVTIKTRGLALLFVQSNFLKRLPSDGAQRRVGTA